MGLVVIVILLWAGLEGGTRERRMDVSEVRELHIGA
jgi:hypothetical protein